MKFGFILFAASVSALILGTAPAQALEKEYSMEMTGTGFSPKSLEVPAGQKIRLTVKNTGSAQSEFESYPLDQEQKIEGGKSTDMFIGPLEPGEYPVFDDNNPDITGSIVAK